MFTRAGVNRINANMRGIEDQKKLRGEWEQDNDIFYSMKQLELKNKTIIVEALAGKQIYSEETLLKRSRGRFLGLFTYNIIKDYIKKLR